MESAPVESDLVRAAQSGDVAAFEALVTRHRTLIWSVCLRVTGNTYDAEDAMQDTLLATWRGIARFRGHSSFSTWIYRIASNAALSVVRRRREVPTEVVDDRFVERDFAQALADSDFVQQALKTVPANFRVALVLYEACDLSYAQIAEHQGIGIQTVKSRINRARQALLAVLEDAGTS